MNRVEVEKIESGYRLYLGKASVCLAIDGDSVHVHDLVGDPENSSAVLLLVRKCQAMANKLGLKRAALHIDINDKGAFEAYAKLGFRMKRIWMEKNLDEVRE